MKKVIVMAVILATTALTAQHEQNEDLAFIKEWQRTQSIEAIAQAAALTADQVATLVAVKAEVDAIKADAEAQRDAFQDNLAVVAASVRANIEATGDFSEEDKAALCDARSEGRLAGKEVRMRIGLAVLPLENLLTEEQRAAIGEAAQANRGQGCGEGRAERGREGGQRQGQGQGQGEGQGRDGQNRGKGKIMKILLSDAFINYYQ